MKLSIKRAFIGLSLSAGVALTPAKAQQNIQFTQYIFNTLSVNPAYAGYKEEWFAQTALRAQWVGIDGAPKTGQLSLDGILDPVNKRMGIGFQVTGDKLGPQSVTSAYASYAYRLRLDDADTKRLSFGLAAGFSQYALNGSLLDPITGEDQALPPAETSKFIPDFRFGVYYYSPKWYVGASILDMLAGDSSRNVFRRQEVERQNLNRNRHMYIMTGVLLGLSQDLLLRPSLLVKEDFRGPTSLDLNAMVIFNQRLWLGGSYRTGINLWDKTYRRDQNDLSTLNSISGVAQLYITRHFRVGYSYDYIVSRLSSVQNGSHELTLGLTFPAKGNRIISPRFF